MKTVLFVCTGNVCRSPMAEGIFRYATQGKYRAMSAGLGAMEGQPPSIYAVQAVNEVAVERSGARQLEGRTRTMETRIIPTDLSLDGVDPEIARLLELERRRQQENIELIASENFTSPAVMEAQGSVLTNKYAEGYPKKRWYGGCENVDAVEQIAIDRAKRLFGAEHANVQPHSGSGANMAVYFAFLKPGDKMLTMDLSHGGHLTHGNKANFSGRFFEIVHYGVRKDDERIDYDQLAVMAREHKPKMIKIGRASCRERG